MIVKEQVFVAAQSGNVAALEQLLRQLQPDIRRYARFQCRHSSAVDDVVQEALIILYRRIGTVRSAASLGAWLARIVARLCMLPALMFMRGVEELKDGENSHQLVQQSVDELRIDLARAIESLPDMYRQIIILRDFRESTVDEIANALSLTRSAVKSRLHRARAMIREYLIT